MIQKISLEELLAVDPNSPEGNYALGRQDERVAITSIWKNWEEVQPELGNRILVRCGRLLPLIYTEIDQKNWIWEVGTWEPKAWCHYSDFQNFLPEFAK